MKRILIVGSSGSGKTTLARELSKKLKLPIVYLDHLYWLPGRVHRPTEEFYALMMQACQQNGWIMDGNSIRSLAGRIPFADKIIFIDVPRRTCMWRVIKRAIGGLFSGSEFAPGCRNGINWEFFSWVWHWEARYCPMLVRILARAPQEKVVILQGAKAIADFLATL